MAPQAPTRAERGVVGEPDAALTQVVDGSRSEPAGPVGARVVGHDGTRARVAGDVEDEIEVVGEFGQPAAEEGPHDVLGECLHRNVLVTAGVRGPAIQQDLHWSRHPPRTVADFARSTEQRELVEVVVEHGAEPLQGVATVLAGELLREVVGERVRVAEPLALQQNKVGGERGSGLDGDAAVVDGRADAFHDVLLCVIEVMMGLSACESRPDSRRE
ncbi:hypothetical protein P3T37_002190 [Kitasatospora sp. MAA4]|nr:hypothetical protein [Kitasatospora sp. MAA4]